MKDSFIHLYSFLNEMYKSYNYRLYEEKLFIYIVNRINATQ